MMKKGEVVSPSPGEKITCVKSGEGDGVFIFDLELEPGVGGPPLHSHDEGEEMIEVLEGRFDYRVAGGDWKGAGLGERINLAPTVAHTFRNGSKTERVLCRVTHGKRFERVIAQPGFVAMSIYATDVDPGASRLKSRGLTWLMWAVARVGTLMGARARGLS